MADHHHSLLIKATNMIPDRHRLFAALTGHDEYLITYLGLNSDRPSPVPPGHEPRPHSRTPPQPCTQRLQ